jgi:hypothetical protein
LARRSSMRPVSNLALAAAGSEIEDDPLGWFAA